MGLLRWAGTSKDALIRGLRTKFAGIGQDMDLWVDGGREWWGRCRNTDIHVHCHAPASRTEAEVAAQEAEAPP